MNLTYEEIGLRLQSNGTIVQVRMDGRGNSHPRLFARILYTDDATAEAVRSLLEARWCAERRGLLTYPSTDS